MPGRRASPRRAQQVGCLGLWPGEHHERRVRPLSIDRGKGSLGWTEPIVLLSRGPPLNSRHLERVRRPTTGQKPGNRRVDPSIGPNGPCRALAWFAPSIGTNGPCPACWPVPVAPNKLGAWGCGLVFHHERLLGFCLSNRGREELGLVQARPDLIVLLSRGRSEEHTS